MECKQNTLVFMFFKKVGNCGSYVNSNIIVQFILSNSSKTVNYASILPFVVLSLMLVNIKSGTLLE